MELIYFEGCPINKRIVTILQSLDVVYKAINQTHLPTDSPYLNYSSPTVLVDGAPIFGGELTSNRGGCTFQNIDKQEIRRKLMRKMNEGPNE